MPIQFALLMLGLVTTALGIFFAAAPERSARIWGKKRLDALTCAPRTWYLRGFRTLGVLLCLAGLLVSLQSLGLKS